MFKIIAIIIIYLSTFNWFVIGSNTKNESVKLHLVEGTVTCKVLKNNSNFKIYDESKEFKILQFDTSL